MNRYFDSYFSVTYTNYTTQNWSLKDTEIPVWAECHESRSANNEEKGRNVRPFSKISRLVPKRSEIPRSIGLDVWTRQSRDPNSELNDWKLNQLTPSPDGNWNPNGGKSDNERTWEEFTIPVFLEENQVEEYRIPRSEVNGLDIPSKPASSISEKPCQHIEQI